MEQKVELAKCLRTLKGSQEFKKVFDEWLFGSELQTHKESFLQSVEVGNSENEKLDKQKLKVIWDIKHLLEYIESDGKQAALYLTKLKEQQGE